MNKIVVIPVKNEEWILDYSLSCASLWADYIIVADQNSTDRTPEICKNFKKVIYIKNDYIGLNMSFARQLLLDEVRKIKGENILFALDADEVLSSNCINNITFNNILNNLKLGDSIQLEWIQLWGNINQYRNDNSVWSNNYKHFIFKDDRKYNFKNKETSEPRIPEEYMKNSIIHNDIKNIHFEFVNLDRMLSKQRRYRIYDYINSNKKVLDIIKINLMYYSTKIISNIKTSKIPSLWINTNINLSNKQYYWYDEDILAQIQKKGIFYFKYIDIWDIDWNKIAKYLEIKGNFNDPRNIFIKIYHKIGWLLYKINKIVPNKIKKYL